MRDNKTTYAPPTVVPSPPGYFVARYCEEYELEPDYFHLDPVIAWIIQPTLDADGRVLSENEYGEHHFRMAGDVIPVTYEGPQGICPLKLLKLPNGHFDDIVTTFYETEEDALAACREAYKPKESAPVDAQK
jgi:hypothetical protein